MSLRYRLYLLSVAMLAAPLASAQSSLAPETEKCLALRARYDIETPTSGDRIFAYTAAAHHTTVEYCTVAWRDAAGLWTPSAERVKRAPAC